MVSGLIFVPVVAVIYYFGKEKRDSKIRSYIKEKGGRYISETALSLYKNIYAVIYKDGQGNLRKVRVRGKLFKVIFEEDEIIEP